MLFSDTSPSSHDGSIAVDILKGMAAGIIGGLVGTFVMTKAQEKLQGLIEGDDQGQGRQRDEGRRHQGSGRDRARAMPLEGDQGEQGDAEDDDPATVKAANALTRTFTGHDLPERQKEKAGTITHYAFGTATGAVYGTAAEALPLLTLGYGIPFGALVWLGADEITVPALGLSEPPSESPMKLHLYALASHLVYGLTAEVVRRGVRRALG